MGEVTFIEVFDRRGRLLTRHRVDHWPITVGRAYANDVIVDDPYVSPTHLRLSHDGDGLVLVEDLGSVNGTRSGADGRDISHAAVAPDTPLRIGNSVVRVRSGDTAVPPALVQRSGRAVAEVLRRTPIALACWLLILPALLDSVFIQGYSRPDIWTFAGTGVFLVACLATWAGAWALVTRVVAHEWRFLAHTAVACIYLVMDLLADVVQGYVAFLGGGTWPGTFLGALCNVMPAAWLFNGHLSLLGTMSRLRRVGVATVVALGLVGLVTFISNWTQHQFSSVIHFDATLRPLPSAWIPGAPIDTLVMDVPGLESEVRELAAETPRGGLWMSPFDLTDD